VKAASIALRRLHGQRLIGEPFADAESAVGWLTAVQAQDYSGAKWAIGQRVAHATDALVDAAFQQGKILRTHVLRPTWHFVLPADIRWLLSLSAPRVHARNAGMYKQLALDATTFKKSEKVMAKALNSDGPRTRAELQASLERAGISAAGLRLSYLTMHAELEALICSGPRRGKQFTYALFDERARPSKPLSRDQALARLTHRYFESHGPATAADFAWWAGLTLADVRRGLAQVGSELIEESIADESYWSGRASTAPTSKSPTLHLLPNYDEAVIAYKDYGPSFDPTLFTRRVGSREAVFANHLIARDGKLIGGWRRVLEKHTVAIEATLLCELDARGRRGLSREAERLGRFLDLPAKLRKL
jgi:hypothetical protein